LLGDCQAGKSRGISGQRPHDLRISVWHANQPNS